MKDAENLLLKEEEAIRCLMGPSLSMLKKKGYDIKKVLLHIKVDIALSQFIVAFGKFYELPSLPNFALIPIPDKKVSGIALRLEINDIENKKGFDFILSIALSFFSWCVSLPSEKKLMKDIVPVYVDFFEEEFKRLAASFKSLVVKQKSSLITRTETKKVGPYNMLENALIKKEISEDIYERYIKMFDEFNLKIDEAANTLIKLEKKQLEKLDRF